MALTRLAPLPAAKPGQHARGGQGRALLGNFLGAHLKTPPKPQASQATPRRIESKRPTCGVPHNPTGSPAIPSGGAVADLDFLRLVQISDGSGGRRETV